jgi:Family of unknown function (DUF6188)
MEPRGANHRVEVEGPMSLTDGGTTVDLDTRTPTGLGPVLGLRGTWLSSRLAERGALTLEFEDGSRIDVPANEQYESWHVYGPGHVEWHCIPGGHVVEFRPQNGFDS